MTYTSPAPKPASFQPIYALAAVLIHLIVGLGGGVTLIFMALVWSGNPAYAWASHFTILWRGLLDPNLSYFTLVAVALMLLLPVATALFDAVPGRRAGSRAGFAAAAGFVVVLLYVILSHAPEMMGMPVRLTVMAEIGIFGWAVYVFIGLALVQVPLAMLAGWVVDRFYGRVGRLVE